MRKAICTHPAGILGNCFLRRDEVEELSIDEQAMNLVVKLDQEERPYGDRHHVIQDPASQDLCPSREVQKQLARQASENGGIIPMRPNPPIAV